MVLFKWLGPYPIGQLVMHFGQLVANDGRSSNIDGNHLAYVLLGYSFQGLVKLSKSTIP